MHLLKLDKADDGKGGGGSGTPPADGKPPASNQPPAEDDRFDELGYEKTAATPPSEGEKDKGGKGGKESEPPPAADDKIEDPATGYDEDPSKVEDPPPAPPAEPPKGDDVDLGFELKMDGVPTEKVKELKEEIKDLGLSKEQAEKYLNRQKSKFKAADEDRVKSEEQEKKQQQETRKSWMSELKNDPTFGGEKYGSNIKRVEKVIAEFMPDLKKVLTERKSMLPPYVMRGLANVADHLYSTGSLKQGEPPAPPAKTEEQDDALAFYN